MTFFDAALHCHEQRVIIEGVHSDWCNIEAGVPHGSCPWSIIVSQLH